MSEFNTTPNLQTQADDIVARWVVIEPNSEADVRFEQDVLLPSFEASGALGMLVLEHLGGSDDQRLRSAAAAYMRWLPADTPKDRYLAMAEHLLGDDDNNVFHTMWDSLRDNSKIDLSWNDVRFMIDDAARAELLQARP
jgi:hypothetical protein